MTFESVLMSDESCSLLLQGALDQQNSKGKTFLKNFIYSNGTLGQSTINVLSELFEEIENFSIDNL
tara:strand:- start:523 stop:720 length:198 start_codon:yes stop_codon:yes gene_type:complete